MKRMLILALLLLVSSLTLFAQGIVEELNAREPESLGVNKLEIEMPEEPAVTIEEAVVPEEPAKANETVEQSLFPYAVLVSADVAALPEELSSLLDDSYVREIAVPTELYGELLEGYPELSRYIVEIPATGEVVSSVAVSEFLIGIVPSDIAVPDTIRVCELAE